jgi:hypothetical protein
MRIFFVAALLAAFLSPAPAAFAQALAATTITDPPALSDDDLAALRGAQHVTMTVATEQAQTAISTDNSVSADSIVNGDIVIDDGALSDFNGIGNFVFNTGNNSTLQGNLSVIVITTP